MALLFLIVFIHALQEAIIPKTKIDCIVLKIIKANQWPAFVNFEIFRCNYLPAYTFGFLMSRFMEITLAEILFNHAIHKNEEVPAAHFLNFKLAFA